MEGKFFFNFLVRDQVAWFEVKYSGKASEEKMKGPMVFLWIIQIRVWGEHTWNGNWVTTVIDRL